MTEPTEQEKAEALEAFRKKNREYMRAYKEKRYGIKVKAREEQTFTWTEERKKEYLREYYQKHKDEMKHNRMVYYHCTLKPNLTEEKREKQREYLRAWYKKRAEANKAIATQE